MYGRLIKNSLENTSEIEYDYDKGNLSSITRTGTEEESQVYQFSYDIWGNRTSVSVGEKQLASYTYKDKNGSLSSMNYGNGDGISYNHDEFGRVKTATYSDGRILTYAYSNEGELYSVHDSSVGQTWYYNYDSLDRLHQFQTDEIQAYFKYDSYNRLTSRVARSAVGETSESYTYDADSSNWISDGLLVNMQMTSFHKITYKYDELQRLSQKHIHSGRSGGGFWEEFFYKDGNTSGTTTSLISQKKNWSDNVTLTHDFHYTYDANGNILTETESENGTSVTYTYDNQNQLLTATYGDGRTETYTYDTAGNILTFNNGITSHTYTYSNEDWKDLLTAVDGVTLTYDEIGNPLTYYNGNTYTMNWIEGRRLQAVTTGEDTTTYQYDYNGYRTKKTNPDGSYTKYYIVDGRTVGEIQYKADGTPELYVRYTYDENGSIIGFSLWGEDDTSWTVYYFLKNLQGDVIQIYKASNNEVVAEYTYDSWGNVLSATGELAELNPFRYRGYYYDEETGFYYLTSRYYDPEIGRFLNADAFLLTGQDISGANMYTYCGNNPVKRIDTTGKFWSEICGFFQDVITGIGNAISQSAPAYAGLGSLTLVDGPCPLADTMAAIGALAVTAEAIGQGINQAAQAKEEEEAKAIAKANKQKNQAFFPINPYDFSPQGLIMTEYPGTKNGRIIEWRDPISRAKIFEWNEDFKNGAHYHTMMIEWDGKCVFFFKIPNQTLKRKSLNMSM